MSAAYEVVSGTYSVMEWVCEYGGPHYDAADVCVVIADSPHDAKWIAYNSAEFRGWATAAMDNEWHPLHGFRVRKLDDTELAEAVR